MMQQQSNIPQQFIWPDHEKPSLKSPELHVPVLDLGDFLSGDPIALAQASKLVDEACKKHGFFLVMNHGVNANLIANAHHGLDKFFKQPLHEKQIVQRKLGEHFGYASSFIGRFSSKLPWKETLSFGFSPNEGDSKIVEDYFHEKLGEEFVHLGYEKR